MRRAFVVLITLLVASGATAATLAARRTAAPVQSFDGPRRAGADSARVVAFLDAIGAADPLVCEMVSDQVGNFWWSDDDLRVGRVSDARTGLRAAKDSISSGITDPAAIRMLAARLDGNDPCVRLTAAKMLGNSAITEGALERLLDAPSARAREAALRAAGERDRPALRGRVERLLGAPEPAVAAMAAWGLGEFEERASVPALRRALAHDAAQVRVTAAWALGSIEDVAATGDLESRASTDPDRRVRLASVRALGELQQRRSLDVLARIVEGAAGDAGLAVAAVQAIGELDDLETAPRALVGALESPNAELRYAALHALAEIPDESLAPSLLPYITDADPDVRRLVVEAMGELRARIAVPALKRALNDANAEVRRAAIEALAEIEER